jgi:hypothetical protein
MIDIASRPSLSIEARFYSNQVRDSDLLAVTLSKILCRSLQVVFHCDGPKRESEAIKGPLYGSVPFAGLEQVTIIVEKGEARDSLRICQSYISN